MSIHNPNPETLIISGGDENSVDFGLSNAHHSHSFPVGMKSKIDWNNVQKLTK